MLTSINYLKPNTNYKQDDYVDCIPESKKDLPQLATKMTLVTLK